MLGDALEYPARGDDAPTTILVGGLLPLLSILIAVVGTALAVVIVGLVVLPLAVVPGIVLRGYRVAVLRAVGSDEPEPPRFRNWRRLFADGLRHLAITVVYAIPVAVPVGLFLGIVFAGGGADSAAAEALVALAAVASGALAVCGLLGFAYLRPLAIANFARENELRAAFDRGAIRTAALSRAYAAAWLLAAVVWLVGATLEGAFSVVLVGLFVGFYADVAGCYLYGRGLRTALDAPEGIESADETDRADERERGDENASEFESDRRPVPPSALPAIEEYETFAARVETIDRERGWTDWETDRSE